MGKAMATNLVTAHDLTVHDIREEPLRTLHELGAKIARSPKEVAEQSEITQIAVVDDSHGSKDTTRNFIESI